MRHDHPFLYSLTLHDRDTLHHAPSMALTTSTATRSMKAVVGGGSTRARARACRRRFLIRQGSFHHTPSLPSRAAAPLHYTHRLRPIHTHRRRPIHTHNEADGEPLWPIAIHSSPSFLYPSPGNSDRRVEEFRARSERREAHAWPPDPGRGAKDQATGVEIFGVTRRARFVSDDRWPRSTSLLSLFYRSSLTCIIPPS